ncbi:ShlB/FhaC/HecB family hemolysin secretion/activation protein [uncultured Algibacter sp.]|uniref:ShlB/FhaC/HecB family hemolysin secretion/activation protein n=1 Tax=uncultured Algibacter sp. TaxID=298659 RepID=UPI00262BDF57|nr:ShlB/FhaC/HecB family hemolysin secretion/activation protein [uncultured Algibacter sp.]
MPKTSYLILIISVFFSLNGYCQKLTLKIEGNTKYEIQVIDSLGYLKTHSDFLSIKSEIDALQKALFNLGYIENETKKLKKTNDSTFHSQIKLKSKFKSLYVYYNKNDIDFITLNSVSKEVYDDYFILNLSETENALNIINSEIAKKGFPFSNLKLSDLKTIDTSTLQARLIINSSKSKRIIDNIILKGYENFPRSYLNNFLKIKPKQVFDLNTIKNKTEQLNNLNFANEIKPPEVLFSKDSTTLYLYLEKSKSNAFDGFLGFGTNEETNNLEFDGYLNLNLNNNLNFGEAFRLLYKSDENDQKTFEADISLPYLFNSPIGVDFLLRIFKKDSSFTTVNQSAKLHYQINVKHKLYAGIVSTESNNLLSDNSLTSIADYNTTQYTIAYQYLKPQSYNLLFPFNSKIYFETGFGERNSSKNKEKQSQLSIDALKIFNLNKKNSFYIRLNGSNLISDTYFENELLRFGGINSIRGFEENSLFATLYSFINTEYRFQLNNSIYIHSIIDAGYFENKIQKTKKKLFGYGFGFGIITKSGLLKLNYANGKTENTKFKLSNSKIHISLTANF